MKKEVKLLWETLKENENSFTMIEFFKFTHDIYESNDFNYANELKERKKKE
jgi:hypothetical protein